MGGVRLFKRVSQPDLDAARSTVQPTTYKSRGRLRTTLGVAAGIVGLVLGGSMALPSRAEAAQPKPIQQGAPPEYHRWAMGKFFPEAKKIVVPKGTHSVDVRLHDDLLVAAVDEAYATCPKEGYEALKQATLAGKVSANDVKESLRIEPKKIKIWVTDANGTSIDANVIVGADNQPLQVPTNGYLLMSKPLFTEGQTSTGLGCLPVQITIKDVSYATLVKKGPTGEAYTFSNTLTPGGIREIMKNGGVQEGQPLELIVRAPFVTMVDSPKGKVVGIDYVASPVAIPFVLVNPSKVQEVEMDRAYRRALEGHPPVAVSTLGFREAAPVHAAPTVGSGTLAQAGINPKAFEGCGSSPKVSCTPEAPTVIPGSGAPAPTRHGAKPKGKPGPIEGERATQGASYYGTIGVVTVKSLEDFSPPAGTDPTIKLKWGDLGLYFAGGFSNSTARVGGHMFITSNKVTEGGLDTGAKYNTFTGDLWGAGKVKFMYVGGRVATDISRFDTTSWSGMDRKLTTLDLLVGVGLGSHNSITMGGLAGKGLNTNSTMPSINLTNNGNVLGFFGNANAGSVHLTGSLERITGPLFTGKVIDVYGQIGLLPIWHDSSLAFVGGFHNRTVTYSLPFLPASQANPPDDRKAYYFGVGFTWEK